MYQTTDVISETCIKFEGCTEAQYQAVVQTTDQRIDTYVRQANQSAIIPAGIVSLVGLVIIASALIKPLHKILVKLASKLIIGTPLLLGILVGGAIGFFLQIGCFVSQSCSNSDSPFIFLVPVIIGLCIGLSFSIRQHGNKKGVSEWTAKRSPRFWTGVGVAIILLSISYAVGEIRNNYDHASQLKAEIRTDSYKQGNLKVDETL